MARIQFSNLAAAIAVLTSDWGRMPIPARFDLEKATRMANRRHARHYGTLGKKMPRAMRAGSRPALRYAARIAAGKIPESQILRNPVWAKVA